jgi:MFS family permease
MGNIIEKKISSYRWWILIITSLVNIVVVNLAWMCMPVLFDEISQKTGWSIAKLFASWGLIPLAIAFLMIPAGLIGDRYGIRWVGGIGIIIMSIAGALRGFSDSYIAFMLWMFLFGCTFPFAVVLIPKALGMYFAPRELGMANGICFGAAGAGAAFSLSFSGTIISPDVGGWQNVVYLYGALSFLI